jgi:hypothetical protein
MTTPTDLARNAVRQFAAEMADLPEPDRLCVRLHGDDGMASLCAVEAAILDHLAASPAKELIWLTQTAAGDTLHLQAFAGGALLMEASYGLGPVDG